ncbi:hypothetical protein GGU10DRAFT_193598 [Lentinula aff. detonsa]|uniref:Uncharacterized protein n=1 Tax=Lentinula aff. detonsa TaxID=2804958 RepID=A0AA38KSB5_9AGAR|nr:hypothetical protein GGU10DRAFT_193598 [Lentinula aff. detonsa]
MPPFLLYLLLLFSSFQYLFPSYSGILPEPMTYILSYFPELKHCIYVLIYQTPFPHPQHIIFVQHMFLFYVCCTFQSCSHISFSSSSVLFYMLHFASRLGRVWGRGSNAAYVWCVLPTTTAIVSKALRKRMVDVKSSKDYDERRSFNKRAEKK